MLYFLDTHFLNVKKFKVPRTFLNKIPLGISEYFSVKNTKIILTVSLLLIILGFIFGQYNFDSNLLNLQASDSKANHWQKILLEKEDRSLFAISTFKDRGSLANAQEKYNSISNLVKHTESLYPARELAKREILATACDYLSPIQVQEAVSSAFGLKRQIWNLRQTVRKFSNANSEAKQALAPLSEELNSLYAVIGKTTSGQLSKSITYLDSEIKQGLTKFTHEVNNIFCVPNLEYEQIPGVLKDRFLGKNGALALFIYPAENIWEQENLEQFVQAVQKIDPNVIGQAVSLYENGQSLYKSFLQASTYSLIAIVFLLLIWSRSLLYSFLTLVPLVTSLGLLLGVMKWLPSEIVWNFTNFFALPILIGIGVDSGIHLVQARKDKNPETFQGAIKAVFLSTMTTMVGFGILATSNHLGVASLGLVLFIGISFCLLASLTILPAALNLFLNKELSQK